MLIDGGIRQACADCVPPVPTMAQILAQCASTCTSQPTNCEDFAAMYGHPDLAQGAGTATTPNCSAVGAPKHAAPVLMRKKQPRTGGTASANLMSCTRLPTRSAAEWVR